VCSVLGCWVISLKEGARFRAEEGQESLLPCSRSRGLWGVMLNTARLRINRSEKRGKDDQVWGREYLGEKIERGAAEKVCYGSCL